MLLRASRLSRRARRVAAIGVVVGVTLALASTAFANVPIKVVKLDPYTNHDSTVYHKTAVEPDTFSAGSTIVSTFQLGRYNDGGATNVGFATSRNNGVSWRSNGLPNLTINGVPPGPYHRATDPGVTYDAQDNVWMIVTLDSLATSGFTGNAVTVSRSTDGGATWGVPVTVKNASGFQSFDSTWINCDNTSTSPHYGNCYVEWDDNGSGNILHLSTSTDGGLTWHEATTPGSIVIGGKPVVQPNGTVVVPIDDGFASSAESFVSTDGGTSYSGPFSIASYQIHGPAGSLRALDILSTDVDASGKIYVVWYDCRFRSGCSSNDIVMSTSTNGMTWTTPVRIPIDPTTSTDDHFIPGIAVKPGTSGSSAGLALVYWFYPQANCTDTTCQLSYGYITSSTGGSTWGTATQVFGPLGLHWIPFTVSGYMVGDYSSVSYVTGGTQTVFAAAQSSNCTQGGSPTCKMAMVAPKSPLPAAGPQFRAGHDRVATHLGHVRGELRSTY